MKLTPSRLLTTVLAFWMAPLDLLAEGPLFTGPAAGVEPLAPPSDDPGPGTPDSGVPPHAGKQTARPAPSSSGDLVTVPGVWTPQGPGPISGGQVEGMTDKFVCGAIHAVIAHPTDSNIIYIGAVNGGVWKTTNATAASPTWTTTTSSEASLSIGALAFDPLDPTSNTVWAGIGRFSSYSRTGGSRSGLLKTTDGGLNWAAVDGGGTLVGKNISGLVVRGNTILVSVNTGDTASNPNLGVWRSTDGGVTFTQMAVGDGTATGLPEGVSYDIVSSPSAPNILYTCIALPTTASAKGIFKSNDLGATWARVSTPLIESFITSVTSNIEMSVGNSSNVFFGILESGAPVAIFSSTDGGASWAKMDLPTMPVTSAIVRTVTDATNATPIVITTSVAHGYSTNNYVEIAGVTGNTAANGIHQITSLTSTSFSLDFSAGNGAYAGGGTARFVTSMNPRGSKGPEAGTPEEIAGGQGTIHFSILADPTDATLVYVGGDRQDLPFPNYIGASDYSGNLWRGSTALAPNGLSPSSQWKHLTHSNAVAAIPGGGTSDNSSPHADSRDMAMDAAGRLIEVDDGGIFRRTSPQNNTGAWTSLAGNLQVTEAHNVTYDTVSNIVITGNQDNGTSAQNSTGSDAYTAVSTADGGDVAASVNPANAAQSIRYSSFQNLSGFRKRIMSNTNTLVSQTFPTLTPLGGASAISGQFTTPVEINRVNANRLIFGASNGVYESTDQGATVSRVSTLSPNDGRSGGRTMFYGGRKAGSDNAEVIYFADGSLVYRRVAAAVTPAAVAGYSGSTVRSVVADSEDYDHLFAIDNDQVFRSTNGGASFTDITGDIPSAAKDFRSLEFIRAGGEWAIVVGTLRGVYAARYNAVSDWALVGSDIPNAYVWDMDYDADDNLLVISTLGRGVWSFANARDIASDGRPGFPEIVVEQPLGTALIDGAGSQDFALVPVGVSAALTFTIRNVGGTDLTGLSISKSGTHSADFTVGSLGATTLAFGASTTFAVTFAPSALGARNAAIHIASNDADENPFDIALNGTGLTPGSFTNFQDASVIIGQANSTDQLSTASQSVTPGPTGCAISATGKLAVCDQTANRVLIWNSVPTSSGVPADVVVGKANFTDTAWGTTASLTGRCEGVAFSPDGQKLLVSDAGNNRVLIWNTVPTTNGVPADVVIGQTNFTTGTAGLLATKFNFPAGLHVTQSGRLLVAEVGNHRVVIFNSIPTSNGAAADVVIGQATMTTKTAGASASQMNLPWDVEVTADGRLLVAEEGNNRVLVFGSVPVTNGASASVVIGQSAFGLSGSGTSATTMSQPLGVAVSPTGVLAVSNAGNSRVLIFNSVPATNGAAADAVLGQPSFLNGAPFNGGVSARSMFNPSGLVFAPDGRLLVAGSGMKRVMVFGSPLPEIAIEEPAGNGLTDGTATRDFGPVPAGGTASRIFTIRNVGAGSLAGLSVSKSGTHSADFTVGALGAPTLAPGASTTFTVTFAPGALGARNAAIQIASNDFDENPFDIALNGTGLPPPSPEIAVEEPAGSGLTDGVGTTSFGPVASGGTASRTFTIRNVGTGSLTGLSVSKSGTHSADFTVGALGAPTLAPGTSTTFAVTFAPGAPGARNAAIQIASNDADENPFDIALTGTGVSPLVTTNSDSGPGSLRQAIAGVSAGTTITFAPNLSGATILLTSGQLLVEKNLTIDASALPGGLTISGGGVSRVFAMAAGTTVALDSLTVTGGNAADSGGGLQTTGVIVLNRCTFFGNTAYEGGAVRCAGGASSLTATNCTFSGNTAQIGGAMSIADGGPAAVLSHVTIVGNTATDSRGGGGIFFFDKAATLSNCLVAGNASPAGLDVNGRPSGPDIKADIGAVITPAGANLIGNNASISTVFPAGPLVGTAASPLNPQLATLGNYGGSTQTMRPLPGSPAINAAASSLTTDQRGRSRPSGSSADIGAVEFVPAEIAVEQPAGTDLVDGTASIDFGMLTVGIPGAARTFVITNRGDANLTLTNIAPDGPNSGDFAVVSPAPTTLTPGASTTFTVTFTPGVAGARNATLRIASNDPDETSFDIALTGTGRTRLETWRLTYFGSSANSGDGANANDFEFDGMSNLLEFGMNRHPKQASQPPQSLVRNGGNLEFTYIRAKAAVLDGVLFAVKWTDTLTPASWSSAGVSESILSDNGIEQVVKATLPAGPNGQRFVHLEVTGN